MKKFLGLLFALFFPVVTFSATTYYSDTEQKYYFGPDALKSALEQFVPDENNRIACAELYQSLMNQDTGEVSVTDLLAVCRKAGFNTYRKDGFDKCQEFVGGLLTPNDTNEMMSGFCPGLDGNGNNPNALKTITDKTQIGDFCSSTNIYAGEVVFRKGYNCTCMATACNLGYEFKSGACVTQIADGNGFCLRKSFSETNENNTTEKCKTFCENKYKGQACKFNSIVMRHSTKECICNANSEEIDSAKASMSRAKEKQKANLTYYEVCGKDRNITGKNKYCVEDFFNWTQTQIDQAIGLSQEYAKIKNNHTIYCKNQHRNSGNDDYIACSTMDGSAVYEFKFDDIKESVDKERRVTERSALCRLAGGDVGLLDKSNDVCKSLNASQCANLDKLAKKYGHEAKWEKNTCHFTDYGLETMSSEDFDKSLAKIDGLDNYAFFNIQVISIRNNFSLEEEITKYIKNNLSGYQEVRCDPGYRTIKKADGFLQKVVGNHDDIKRCYANNKPIDFVVDDLSELVGYERDSGESGAKCIANDGKFDGHYCRGLTKNECFELERLMLQELKSHGWAGDDDLVDWDEKAGACELNASQFANNLNKTGKYTAIAGLTIAGVFTGGTTTAVAIGLMAVELAGMTGEIVTERQKELLPQKWANAFLAESSVCKQAACAEKTLRENMGKIAQASDMLNRDVLKQVDDELARLAELLPDDRLAEILQNPKAPGCWETWECQETLFTVMQMASLGAAVGKALINLPKVLARKFGAVAAKTAATGATHADDVAKVVAKTADAADDVSDAAKTASKADDIADVAKVASKADDAAKVEKEATEAMSFVDAGRLRNGKLNAEELNQLRKHYPDLSDAELQNKAKAISKELDAQRMLHGGFTDAELKLTENLERAANGGLTSAEQAAVKYKNALKLGSEQVDLSGGWVYISKSGYTDDMFDAAGLKFHLNVAPDDLDKAAPIIQRIVSKYDIPQWKFSQAASDLVGTAQEGKQFTLYMGKNISQNETLLKQLANEIDQTLSANGIRAGRVGDNLATGDRLVPGSRFVHYRYDQVDDMGNIISEYNNSYKFVAPKTGDVLRKSDNIANAAKTTEKADDVARATSGVVRRIDEVFPDNIQFDNAGFYMSKTPLSESDAVSIAEQMNKSDDIIAQAVPIEGTAGGKFKVVSINKKDAATLGAYLDNGVLVRNIDNSSFLRNIEMYKGKEITKIGNTPAFIEDVGSIDGRGIVTIRVGEKKIPFYVSSGQAGKMSVPTGKWEVFWGIGDKNWFNKGTSADILNHYGSSELRQIASALDAKLGDPRNVEIVLSSQLRQGVYHGQGNIARAELGSISHEQINSGLKYKPVADAYGNMTNKNNNVADITSYLRRLH